MKLYFLRHGERGHGKEQDILTDKGIKQTKQVANFFKNIKIDKIISGDLNRARKTAEPIINNLGVKVEFTSEVNEQNLGISQGKTAQEMRDAITQSGLSKKEFRTKGGESEYDVYNRAKKFVEKLKKEKEENILIVSHSGFISYIATILLKKPFEDNKYFKTDFCSISFFELDKDFNLINYWVNRY